MKQTVLLAKHRFLIGGIGGIAPVLLNLAVIDLEVLLWRVTSLAVLSYVIRVMALFVIGGLVAFFNRDENSHFKLFQLGIVAPALITAVINGSNIPSPRRPEIVLTTATSFGLLESAYAQVSAQHEVQQFSLPEETPIQQIRRGFFGVVPRNVWFVIAGSHLKIEDAERQVQEFRKKGFSAEVYAPYGDNPYYAVVIGALLTLSEAQQLQTKAINRGLPADTFLWTFPPAGTSQAGD